MAACKRVLIVDDALIMRKCIRDIAEDAGWQVAGEASNGRQAISMFHELQPELVTLDVIMPELDGVSALKQIVQDNPSARVVMVSAVNQKTKLVECIQAGAIDCIIKPFDKASLRQFFVKQLSVADADKETPR